MPRGTKPDVAGERPARPGGPLRDAGYDAMTAVSSLHHMPLQAALARLTGLLCPGGVLFVVGHYRPATVAIVPWT
jgi:hypothetical protein